MDRPGKRHVMSGWDDEWYIMVKFREGLFHIACALCDENAF